MAQAIQPSVYTLDNGVRVIFEQVSHAKSVSIGYFLGRGSRHELDQQNGMTHFSEHMLFKGTGDMHWSDLARVMNELGGHFNASTSAESVRLYTSAISRDLSEALELMTAMFLGSTFPADEALRERDVILEEIAMYDDSPEDLCYEMYTQALYLPHPVGRPVIGTAELVESFTGEELLDYWRGIMSPDRMVISIAGNFDSGETLRQCERHFGRLSGSSNGLYGMEIPVGRHESHLVDRDLEQINYCFGTLAGGKGDPRRFAWILFDAILGGGMGSRLFDEVREKRGLAYSIGSSITPMHGTGYLMISGSSRPECAADALAICIDQMESLAKTGPTEQELSVAKRQLERSHLLALESLSARSAVNGERELYGLPHLTAEEVVEKLRGVTADEVGEVAREVVNFGKPAVCLVGPLEGREDTAACLDRLG